jgi:signal peptidase I
LPFVIEDRAESSIFEQLVKEITADDLSFRFQAKGKSMLPTIQDGEILHVQPEKLSKLRRGHIVMFRNETGLKAHRIICKRQDQFVTRGDAGLDNDGVVRGEDILGKVIAKECLRTARVVRLGGPSARVKFFLFEARRRLRGFHLSAVNFRL